MLNKFEDPNMRSISKTMKSKFDKYWGDVNKMNKVLFIVVLVHP